MTDNNTIIELKSISKSFDGATMVIDNLNLEIKKGEFVTLLGPSGCGKTTILRMIGGFETPTKGQIFLDGQDISKLPPNKRPINTVFQKYALFPSMNIYDNIAFGLKIKKLDKKTIDEKVKRALEIVDLEGFEKRGVATLSGGQQQRIAIARAIVNEPEILLLDEPLGALDYKMRKEMQLELKEMHRELGITFIFVTHDQEEALTMSDKIVVMADGKIQQVGTPEEIYDTPSNVFVADFIGESNIFNGKMTGSGKVRFCDTEFECVDDYPVGTKIEAMVRPENVHLVPPAEGMLTGEVYSSIFKGIYYEILIMHGKNEFTAQSQKEIPAGTEVGISIDPDGIHVVPYNINKNHYTGIIDDELKIRFVDFSVKIDVAKLFDGVTEKDGVLCDSKGEVIDTEGVKVDAYFEPGVADLSDSPEDGIVAGHIISIIYKGDHYSYIVRSRNDKDYYVDDDWLWNIGDYVSVIVPEDKIEYKLIG
ncbi:MAG: ABC transporter ATP-binding protein [Lachnospiraceae bacterium]|nr:ABC transporter ATP-binding protein [Lachnospiraceae bacterium]